MIFLSILVKTARFYRKRLQNDGVLNFVQFFSGSLCTFCGDHMAHDLTVILRQINKKQQERERVSEIKTDVDKQRQTDTEM